MVDDFARYRYPQWLRVATGAIEVAAAAAMVAGLSRPALVPSAGCCWRRRWPGPWRRTFASGSPERDCPSRRPVRAGGHGGRGGRRAEGHACRSTAFGPGTRENQEARWCSIRPPSLAAPGSVGRATDGGSTIEARRKRHGAAGDRAGFGRTGTSSLKAALEQLGFDPCDHMGEVFSTRAGGIVAGGSRRQGAGGVVRLGAALRRLQGHDRLARRLFLARAGRGLPRGQGRPLRPRPGAVVREHARAPSGRCATTPT
jgi:hypothetical protein